MIYEGVAPTPKTRRGTPPGGYDDDGNPVYTHEDVILNPSLSPLFMPPEGGICELNKARSRIKYDNDLPDDVKTKLLLKAQEIYDIAYKTFGQRNRASVTHDEDYIKSLSPRERRRVIKHLQDTVWSGDTVFEYTDVDLLQTKIAYEGGAKIKAAKERVEALKRRYKKLCKQRDAVFEAADKKLEEEPLPPI